MSDVVNHDEGSVTEYQGMEDATIVYEGSLSVSNGELLINFTTPYCYHGGNLLIGVYNPIKAELKVDPPPLTKE